MVGYQEFRDRHPIDRSMYVAFFCCFGAPTERKLHGHTDVFFVLLNKNMVMHAFLHIKRLVIILLCDKISMACSVNMGNLHLLSVLLLALSLISPICHGLLRANAPDPPIDATTHTFRESARGLIMHKNIVKESRIQPTQIHEVTFVVPQRNMDELERILHDVSDPRSNNYGKHLTREEVAERTANFESRDAILTYLDTLDAIVVSITPYGEYITAQAPVSTWEKMFDTEFFAYSVLHSEHSKTSLSNQDIKIIRAEKYSVPTSLHSHVASVLSTIQMPSMHSRKVSSTPFTGTSQGSLDFSAQIFEGYVTPAVLKAAYNIDTDIGHVKATQAVFECQGNSYSKEDITQFQDTFNLPRIAVNVSVGNHIVSTEVCSLNTYTCAESSLDLQYMMAISTSPTTHYYSDVSLTSYWLIIVSSAINVPKVISISYGTLEKHILQSEMNAFNTEAIKLGVMGTTIVTASGDDGAASTPARYDITQCGYVPEFPSTSPYITSIGATMVRT